MATCATMSLRSARPCMIRSHVVRHHPSRLIVRLHPRVLHGGCKANGPEVVHSAGRCDKQPNNHGQHPHWRRGRRDWVSPEEYMDNLQKDIEAAVEAFVARPRSFGGSPFRIPAAMFDSPVMSGLRRRMAMEYVEDDQKYTITADVPGFSKDDIKITLTDDGLLTIEGHEAAEANEEGAAEEGTTFTRSRDFVRRLQLPADVARDGISAHVENGVLTLTLPKVEKPQAPAPTDIPIQGGQSSPEVSEA